MSALAADAIMLEKMGVPVAAIGSERLAATTGTAIARAHGYADYPFVTVPGFWGDALALDHVPALVTASMPRIERLLLNESATEETR